MTTILIVDDEVPFTRSLGRGLSNFDDSYEVLSANNGKEAIEVLGETEVDLVLSDLRMPEMGGYEFVAYLNRHHPTTPVILMTAFGTPELEQNFRLLGIQNYLEKPIDIDEVNRSVSEALDGSRIQHQSRLVGQSGRRLLEVLLEPLTGNMGGEVVVRHGKNNGRIFVTSGKIAWVAVSNARHNFLTFLAQHTEISQEDLREVFEESRREAKNFGETLIEWGLIERAALHGLLLRHIATAMLEILTWEDTEVMFVPDHRSFSSELTFGLEELLDALTELDSDQVLGWSVRSKELIQDSSERRDQILLQLERLLDLDGFKMAGAFSPVGALLAGIPDGNAALEQVGLFASDLLRETGRLTDQMEIGHEELVHVSSDEAEIIAQKGLLHTILVLNRDGNVGMAKLTLDKVMQEITALNR